MEPEEYCELIVASIPHRRVEMVSAVSSVGGVSAEDVTAEVDVPAFATSAMDGFALDEAALDQAQGGTEVAVNGDIPAGSMPVEIAPGTAVRVMTGAPVPTTAEVVIPVELTDAHHTGPIPDSIRVSSLPAGLRPGWNIRGVGEDTRIGDTVIRAGQSITSAGVGTLAMLGRERVRVERALCIGLIVTGDELHDQSADAAEPFIHNSNLPMLSSAITNAGAIPIERSCGDDPDALLRILDDLENRVDLIITTGGISAGAFEVVRQAFEGEDSKFLRLAMRPGGPQGYGHHGTTPLLHFPGTPTGAFLSFHLFAVSLIAARPLRARWKKALYAGPDVAGHPKAISLAPGRFNPDGEIETTDRSRLRDFSGAEAIIRIPRHPHVTRTGDVIAVLDC